MLVTFIISVLSIMLTVGVVEKDNTTVEQIRKICKPNQHVKTCLRKIDGNTN